MYIKERWDKVFGIGLMANVTINILYDELKRMRGELHELKELRREVHEIKRVLVPEEEIGDAERKELHSIIAEMKGGRERNWRTALGK